MGHKSNTPETPSGQSPSEPAGQRHPPGHPQATQRILAVTTRI
jgi:hypothetical protein